MTHKAAATPRYQATFIAWPTLSFMLLALAITLALGYVPGTGWVIPLVVIILIVLLILGYGVAKFTIGENHLAVRFGLYARKIGLNEIASIETVTLKWWQRVGLLAQSNGIIIAGGFTNQAVRLHLSNGTTLTLAATNPQKLITALSAN